jgi:hypothetical protein
MGTRRAIGFPALEIIISSPFPTLFKSSENWVFASWIFTFDGI